MNPEEALDLAVKLAGGQSALARFFKIKPQSVQQWVENGLAPDRRVLGIEVACGGRVSRYQLRPDLYPSEPLQCVSPLVDSTPAMMSRAG